MEPGSEGYYFYHLDEQKSTAYITGQMGNVVNRYQYDAFGQTSSAEGFSNRILYTGQQYDKISGQYYLRARFYNPSMGRFLQEDVYRGDGLNLYAYCVSNPVMYCDPSGLAKDGARGKQSTTDLNNAIGAAAEYCGWEVTNGANGLTEEYFAGPNGGIKGSHRTDVTVRKTIDDQRASVRVNTTTDASNNIPDSRERRNAQALDGQISARNAYDGEVDSLNQLVTISKTDGKINNVDYNDITKTVDPFNQNYSNPNVEAEMRALQNELNNIGKRNGRRQNSS